MCLSITENHHVQKLSRNWEINSINKLISNFTVSRNTFFCPYFKLRKKSAPSRINFGSWAHQKSRQKKTTGIPVFRNLANEEMQRIGKEVKKQFTMNINTIQMCTNWAINQGRKKLTVFSNLCGAIKSYQLFTNHVAVCDVNVQFIQLFAFCQHSRRYM